MKATELWNCDNLSNLQRLSRKRTLLAETQVGSGLVVVAEIRRQASLEMASVEDDVVVQALPSNRADEALGVWILPRTARCCENLLHAQRLDSQSNLSTVPAVAIADEILGSLSVCERLYDLLCRPSSGRMLGHIKMQQLATIVLRHDQCEQYPHCDGRYRKEID
jgi:hypothetical protein